MECHKEKNVECHKEKNVVILSLGNIRLDGNTQFRDGLDRATVEAYADRYRSEKPLPPVIVFFDGTDNWLADGFHRYEARKVADYDTIEAEVREGTLKDARWHAIGANAEHGLPRTNRHKNKVVAEALAERPEMSDYAIADHCGVSYQLVCNMRKRLPTVGSQQAVETSPLPTVGSGELPEQTVSPLSPPATPVSDDTAPVDDSAPTQAATAQEPVLRTGKDGRTINVANIGKGQKVLCDRCQRVGQVADCQACAQLISRPRKPPTPAPVFDWKAYEAVYGALSRQPALLYRTHGRVDPRGGIAEDLDYRGLQRLLEQFWDGFVMAYEKVTGQKAPVQRN